MLERFILWLFSLKIDVVALLIIIATIFLFASIVLGFYWGYHEAQMSNINE